MDKFQRFSAVFINHMPSVKSCYISLGCLLLFGLLTCITARIHDGYVSIMSPKDQVFLSLGFLISITGFLGASIIPMSPIGAAIIAFGAIASDAPTQEICQPTANEIMMAEQSVKAEDGRTISFDEARSRHKFETQGQLLPIKIGDGSALNDYYSPRFLRGGAYKETHLNLIAGLQSQQWSQTDLCRIALLIQFSGILKAQYSSTYRLWVREFFKVLGRADCPVKPNKKDYINWSRSRVPIENYFFTLVNLYKETGDTTIIFHSIV